MNSQNYFIPRGYALTIVVDAFSEGLYVRQGNPGEDLYAPVVLSADSTVVIGPFNEPRNYLIETSGNVVSSSMEYSGILTSTDDAAFITVNNDVADLAPLGEVNVAEIANDATGTAIATAVNGILAILVAAGLMEAAE